ncbi:MAG: hypothetical protein IKY23_09770 [Lachnospiraceae bacterium]|nr:hypothetical protein [Lachnospiraceae bacterium]
MKSAKQMQGTPAVIEVHYEAIAYWRQEKKICHYVIKGICKNLESVQNKKVCIGYTECSDFISDERYSQKKAKEYKKAIKHKSNSHNKKVFNKAKKKQVKIIRNSRIIHQ